MLFSKSHAATSDAELEVANALRSTDRCDRCGAQAFVEVGVDVTRTVLPLLFCAHHFHMHETAVLRVGRIVADERRRLLAH